VTLRSQHSLQLTRPIHQTLARSSPQAADLGDHQAPTAGQEPLGLLHLRSVRERRQVECESSPAVLTALAPRAQPHGWRRIVLQGLAPRESDHRFDSATQEFRRAGYQQFHG